MSKSNSFTTGALLSSFNQYTSKQYYLLGSYNWKNNSKAIGVQIHQKNRGNLISETNAKIAYKQTIKIQKERSISVSSNIGIYQISLKSTSTTRGSSALSSDIDASFAYSSKSINASGFIGNFLSPSLNLFKEVIKYDRYIGGYISKDVEFYKNKISIQYYIYHQSSNLNWRGSLEGSFNQNIGVGISSNIKSSGLFVRLNEIDVSKVKMDVLLGYSFSISKSHYTLFPLQLQLNFNFEEKRLTR